MEAQAARSLAETSYQGERFSLPPGFLKGSVGSKGDSHAWLRLYACGLQ